MKRYITLSILLVVSCVSIGQEVLAEKCISEPPPAWIREAKAAAESDSVETFAKAFKDPNCLIGVFELPTEVTRTTLSSGQILEDVPGYQEGMIRFNLSKLRCIKPIKGQPPEPVVLITTLMPPVLNGQPRIPAFTPLPGSKWVLALKKTSKEYRISRFGCEDVEKYKFINDRTMFSVVRYGHGALCLKWLDYKTEFPNIPEPNKPSYVIDVNDSLVDDFKAIQLVIPYTQKEKKDQNKISAINKTSKALKADMAKSIFMKVLSEASIPVKIKDPNDGVER